MEKIHLLKWSSSGRIFAAYSNHGKAAKVAEELNKERSWVSWIFRLTGDKWLIQTLDVDVKD